MVEAATLIRRGRSSGGYWLVVAPGRQLSKTSCVLRVLLDNYMCIKIEVSLTRKYCPLVAM